MRKRPEIVALLLFAALVAYAAGLQVFILPVIRNMLATVDAPLALPSRIAATIGQNGLGTFLVFVALLAFVLNRIKPVADRATQALVLNIANLVVVAFIMLQGWIFVDLALSATKIVNQGARKTATATLTMPVGQRVSMR